MHRIQDNQLAQFTGRFRVSKTPHRFPRVGTPVTIEAGEHGAQITVGEPHDVNCLILSGSFDATSRRLKGDYDDFHRFALSLGETSRSKSSRRLTCGIEPKDGVPNSSSWEADEDGP